MACPPQDITEAELAILEVLWHEGPRTTRRIAEVLYPGGGFSSHATVQSLLQRLEQKALVTRSRDSRPQLFAAALDREALLGRKLRRLAERFYKGSMGPLLTHLVRTKGLTVEELRELRSLLDAADPGAAGAQPRRRSSRRKGR